MVEGVALELLCRLLFTEGSNPSLSVSVPFVSITDHNVSNQLPIDTIILIPTVGPLLARDSLFLISVVRKIQVSERLKKANLTPDPFVIYEKMWTKAFNLNLFPSTKGRATLSEPFFSLGSSLTRIIFYD